MLRINNAPLKRFIAHVGNRRVMQTAIRLNKNDSIVDCIKPQLISDLNKTNSIWGGAAGAPVREEIDAHDAGGNLGFRVLGFRDTQGLNDTKLPPRNDEHCQHGQHLPAINNNNPKPEMRV